MGGVRCCEHVVDRGGDARRRDPDRRSESRVGVVEDGGVMEAAWPLAVGGRLVIDGETVFVNAVGGAEVHGFTAAGAPVRFVLTRVTGEERAVANGEEWRFGSVLLDAGVLSAAQLREAADLLGHRNEAWFGYRSGDSLRPSEGEPQAGFDPAQTTLADRLEQKATELGCSVAKLFKKRRELVRRGLVALMDGRAARHAAGPAGDAVLRAAIVAEAQELADASDVRKMQFRARVASRLARESGEPLELPCSRQTFNRIVDEVLGSTGLFRLPAKSRRSAQSAPSAPSEDLGSLVAERPGEYVAIDTTALDVFAIDPFTFQWVGLDLTAALDVITRSILAFRLTPFSTQGVDLALLLSDLLSPTPIDGRWPEDVPYPYCGVPENLVLRCCEKRGSGPDLALVAFPSMRRCFQTWRSSGPTENVGSSPDQLSGPGVAECRFCDGCLPARRGVASERGPDEAPRRGHGSVPWYPRNAGRPSGLTRSSSGAQSRCREAL